MSNAHSYLVPAQAELMEKCPTTKSTEHQSQYSNMILERLEHSVYQ